MLRVQCTCVSWKYNYCDIVNCVVLCEPIVPSIPTLPTGSRAFERKSRGKTLFLGDQRNWRPCSSLQKVSPDQITLSNPGHNLTLYTFPALFSFLLPPHNILAPSLSYPLAPHLTPPLFHTHSSTTLSFIHTLLTQYFTPHIYSQTVNNATGNGSLEVTYIIFQMLYSINDQALCML